jgi:hypothetical protein
MECGRTEEKSVTEEMSRVGSVDFAICYGLKEFDRSRRRGIMSSTETVKTFSLSV